MISHQSFALSCLLFAPSILAHGFVQGIVADGVYYSGYNPGFQFRQDPPAVPGWSDPKDLDNGFVNDYSSPDIACHKEATPGKAYAKVAAGGSLELQWTKWPESHHGPVMDYLANCNGECTTVDKTSLLWNKIDEKGLINDDQLPGYWASDEMIANNNTWKLTIPSNIAPGKYVLRHETIALHSAGEVGGAQNYPQCINLEITGSGSNSLAGGTPYNKLYTAQDAGILINIYQKLSSYLVPGPALIDGLGGNSGSGSSSTSASVSFSTTTATTTATATTATLTTSTSHLRTEGPYKNGTASRTRTGTPSWASVTEKPTTFATVTRKPSASEVNTEIAVPSTIAGSDDDTTTTMISTSTVTVTVTVAPVWSGAVDNNGYDNSYTATPTTTTSTAVPTGSGSDVGSGWIGGNNNNNVSVDFTGTITTAAAVATPTGESKVNWGSKWNMEWKGSDGDASESGKPRKFVCYEELD